MIDKLIKVFRCFIRTLCRNAKTFPAMQLLVLALVCTASPTIAFGQAVEETGQAVSQISLVGANSTDAFFKTRKSEAALPSDHVFPHGRRMPLSFFSLPEKDLRRAKKSGFTMAGPYYGVDPTKQMNTSASEGLKTFFPIGGDRKEMGLPLSGDLQPLDADQIKKIVKSQMKVVLDDPARNEQVAWWYVKPEELRPWMPAEMKYLEIVAETAREFDPLKRPVWMYEPNHRVATELAQTGKFLDVIGKGCYVNTGKANTPNKRPIPHVWIRWSIEQELAAIEEIEKIEDHEKDARVRDETRRLPIPIAVLEMSKDPEDLNEFAKIPDWVRHDVYLSLVSGAKGITIWSGAKRKGFEKTREIFLDAYLQTVNEITNEHGLDQVFLFGERCSDLQIECTQGPKTIPLQVVIGKKTTELEYPSVTFLDAAFENNRFLILVNSAETTVNAKISGLPTKGSNGQSVQFTGQYLLDKSQPTVVDGTFTTEIKPLGVQVWKFNQESPKLSGTHDAIRSK